MDELNTRLLAALQKHFPLSPRPFHDLGAALGLQEDEVLARVQDLKSEGVIRQISAIFDSRALGYQSALVAARAEPAQLEAAAAEISRHAGVSHNYQREHDYNLWFTLALAPGLDFAAELARLGKLAGLKSYLILPSLRTFKIEVQLEGGAMDERSEAPAKPAAKAPQWLSEKDKDLVRALQQDLELHPRPFGRVASFLGMTEEALFDWMAEAGSQGLMRRFAAILRHRKAGFSANGMGVWRVPPGRVEEAGKLFASYKSVSHCYERPSGGDWPYNLFTMAHARSREECDAFFSQLSRESGLGDYRVLYSTKEFKKERVKYFLEGSSPAIWRSLESPRGL